MSSSRRYFVGYGLLDVIPWDEYISRDDVMYSSTEADAVSDRVFDIVVDSNRKYYYTKEAVKGSETNA